MAERILDTADRLFYGQGIRAIGVDTIAAEAGISKRTLYNHFPSKDDLIVAYLQRRLRPPLRRSDAPPRDQILGLFTLLERAFAHRDFRGCPYVNAVAEIGEPDHPARPVAVEFKERQRVWFRDLLTQANAADPEGLATQLMLLVDGAIATALVRKDAQAARAAAQAAGTLLTAADVR
ncbi:TetR/AcrR family transcriptional regulator [Phreatobacter stygius]|uniref:TetR/AcrR family transcriptional regulator n=2 Tax=Phreatobacter stygius TaxID=1940610 RepID=A0A4D7BPR9_9HYPH|nr:TetR/AcrR family transcriptional regulator [Phreatobacter stygius]